MTTLFAASLIGVLSLFASPLAALPALFFGLLLGGRQSAYRFLRLPLLTPWRKFFCSQYVFRFRCLPWRSPPRTGSVCTRFPFSSTFSFGTCFPCGALFLFPQVLFPLVGLLFFFFVFPPSTMEDNIFWVSAPPAPTPSLGVLSCFLPSQPTHAAHFRAPIAEETAPALCGYPAVHPSIPSIFYCFPNPLLDAFLL